MNNNKQSKTSKQKLRIIFVLQ